MGFSSSTPKHRRMWITAASSTGRKRPTSQPPLTSSRSLFTNTCWILPNSNPPLPVIPIPVQLDAAEFLVQLAITGNRMTGNGGFEFGKIQHVFVNKLLLLVRGGWLVGRFRSVELATPDRKSTRLN